jgi:hypothetical protein
MEKNCVKIITDPDSDPEGPKAYEAYRSGTLNNKFKGTCKYARHENRVHPLRFRHTARSKNCHIK